MISPQKLAFDIDGVFLDAMSLFLQILEKDYNITGFTLKDITDYMIEDCLDIEVKIIDEIIEKIIDNQHDFEVKAIASSARILQKIGNAGKGLLFITARHKVGHVREWIEKQLFPFESDKIEIIATGSFEAKTELLIANNKQYFLEDRLETCFDLHKAGINPVLYKQPWNRRPHPFIEVSSWEELDILIEF